MSDILLRGAKGGSSGSFKQTPDNLRSTDTFEGVLGVGIGPMKGPTRGLKSVKIDGTAVENESGELNFGEFIVNLGNGDPTQFPQPVQLKLGAGAAPDPVNLAIGNPNASGPGNWVTQTLNNTNADFIDLRFIVQQLYRQDKNGVFTHSMSLEIQLKPVGSATWINPALGSPSQQYNEQGQSTPGLYGSSIRTLIPRSYYDGSGYWQPTSPYYVISGKTTSPTVYELRLAVPNEGAYADTAWDVRVRLIEKDSVDADPVFEKRTVQWESMAAVYGNTLGEHEDWRGLAWLQVYGKASDQLTGVPEIRAIYDTKIVSVPSADVYNPVTRQYTNGIWDGSWAKAFTTDPAWIINDALSDSLSGLSLIAPGSYLNKWDALEVSKWCSTLVPDGSGGQHPRYSLNLAITEPQKAEEFIRYLAGAVSGLAWDQGDGEWRMKIDKPDAPVDLFTLENIEGEFVYSHTDVDTRYNDIIGVFKNEEMDYRQDRVRLFDNPSIALLGRKPISVALVGCTNRQEAARRVKLRLRSTVNETRVVNFMTNRRGRNIQPLDTILIADGDLGDEDKRTTGRVIGVSSDRLTITVRDPVYIASNTAYYMRFAQVNPHYALDTTTQPTADDWKNPTRLLSLDVDYGGPKGVTNVIQLASPLPVDVPDALSFALEADDALPTMPKLYRVTNITPQDDGERVAISALEIDIGKWDASDNVTKEDMVFQDIRGVVPVPLPPLDGDLLSVMAVPVAQGVNKVLTANWIRPTGAFISGFKVSYRINGGAWQTPQERTQLTTFELVNPTPGTYEFEIRTLDRRGSVSEPLSAFLSVTQELLDAAQIRYAGVDPDTPGPSLEDLRPAQAGADVTGSNTANDTAHVGGRPVATVLEQLDAAPETDVTPPSIPTGLALTSDIGLDSDAGQIVYLVAQSNPSPESDTAGYVFEVKEGLAGIPMEYPVTTPLIRVPARGNATYYVRVKAFDKSNNYSVYSSAQSTTTVKDTTAPAAPTNLFANAALTSVFLTWDNATAADLAAVDLYENTTNNSGTATLVTRIPTQPGTKGAFTRTGLPSAATRYYWFKSVDTSGNISGFSAAQSIMTASILYSDFTPGLAPPAYGTSLPNPSGYTGTPLFYNTTDGKFYRYSGGAWIANVAAADISGTLTNAQIADLAAAKLTGQITSTQITDSSITTPKVAAGAIVTASLATSAVTAEKISVGAAGQNMILNPTGADNTTGGWAFVNQAGTSTFTANDFVTNGRRGFRVLKNVASAQWVAEAKAVPVVPGKTYVIRFRAYSAVASGAFGLAMAVYHGAARGTNGYVWFDGQTVGTTTPWQGATTTAPGDLIEVTWTCPAGVAWASVLFQGFANTAALDTRFGDVEFFEQTQTIQLADGVITAPKIVAGAVTTNKLSVTSFAGGSLTLDPSLQDPTAWTVGGNAIFQGNSSGPAGPREVAFVGTSSSIVGKPVPLDRAKAYRFRARAYGAAGTMFAGVQLLDASGNNITGDGSYWYYVVPGSAPGTSWSVFQGAFGAGTARPFPSNAAQMAVVAIGNYNGAGTTYIQDPRIEEMMPAELIVDGAITANKITAGTISTVHLAAGAITADKLAVGARGQNLIANGNAETGNTNGWGVVLSAGVGSSTLSIAGTNGSGQYGFYLNKDAKTSGFFYGAKAVPVVPGKTYVARVTTWTSSTEAEGFYVRVWSSSTFPVSEFVSSVNYEATSDLQAANSAISSAVTVREYTWTCPAGMRWATLSIGNWVNGPMTIAFDDVEFFEQTTSAVIADGAITTPKMIAGSINADRLLAASITTPLLAAGAITADKISVGAQRNLQTNNYFPSHIWDSNRGWPYTDPTTGASFGINGASSAAHQWLTNWPGPFGSNELIMFSQSANASGGSGGFELTLTTLNGLTNDHSYRYSVWFMSDVEGGSYYHGTGSNSAVKYLDGTTEGNPYFFTGGITGLTPGKWYLFVGVVHGSALSTSFPQSGQSGVWDPVTGQRLVAGQDFKWSPSSTTFLFRSYQYYAPTGSRAFFAAPRVEELNGGSGSVMSLMQSYNAAAAINANTTTIDGGKLTTGTVTATQIAAATITGTQIAANTIAAGHLQAGSVDATKITVTNLASINSNLGAITAGSININSKFIVASDGTTTIQSAASGERLVITSRAIKVIDAGGNTLVQLGDLTA